MKREKEKRKRRGDGGVKVEDAPSAADGSSSGEPPASRGQRSSNFRKTSSD